MTLVVTTFLAILTLLAALGLIAITLSDPAADAAVGRPVPTLSGTGLDGQPIAIGPDGPLVIVVLAHRCPRCQAELPGLVELIDGGGVPDGLSVLALSTAIDVVRPNYPPSAWFRTGGMATAGADRRCRLHGAGGPWARRLPGLCVRRWPGPGVAADHRTDRRRPTR